MYLCVYIYIYTQTHTHTYTFLTKRTMFAVCIRFLLEWPLWTVFNSYVPSNIFLKLVLFVSPLRDVQVPLPTSLLPHGDICVHSPADCADFRFGLCWMSNHRWNVWTWFATLRQRRTNGLFISYIRPNGTCARAWGEGNTRRQSRAVVFCVVQMSVSMVPAVY
jgi:hypothetical protein